MKEYEIWKNIPSISPDFYVSNLGRVKFIDKRFNKERITLGARHITGYMSVQYDYNRYLVHRLVAHAFIDDTLPLKCPNKHDKDKYQVDHIDTNPSNNRLNNLRIVSAKENSNNPLTKIHQSLSATGKISPMKGKHHNESTKKKLSIYFTLHPNIPKGTKLTKKQIDDRVKNKWKGDFFIIDGQKRTLITNWNDALDYFGITKEYGRDRDRFIDGVNRVLRGERQHYKKCKFAYNFNEQ